MKKLPPSVLIENTDQTIGGILPSDIALIEAQKLADEHNETFFLVHVVTNKTLRKIKPSK